MRPETELQRKIRKHLIGKGFKVVHVPNGAVLAGSRKRKAIQMNSLKSDGLCVGFPDLIVYGSGRRIGHIEVKCEGEKQADNQLLVEGWLTDMGHSYAVCRSVADVDETLVEWGWAEAHLG
tara:strand:+ start:17546 stop:17908 length:363 start_codon:yes stop_codon:yes gene_type:complete